MQLLGSHPDSAPVYHFLYSYVGTHTFGDLAAYSDWKLAFKMFLQEHGIGVKGKKGEKMQFFHPRKRKPHQASPKMFYDKVTEASYFFSFAFSPF